MAGGATGPPNMFQFSGIYMHDFAAVFWEHNIYKIPQRNLCPSTVRIQVDIEGGTQDGVESAIVGVSCFNDSTLTLAWPPQSVRHSYSTEYDSTV